ncbi:MAG: hydroxymethylbilane synthase [Planctomycetota bacterium]|nr:MAG: hydroxymethylbilane synthase [Planctomycetota bacterium]REJ87089.1 MAG: hydroxymethylbilane synthase [Planctomycetota bacterium]REK26993.1 MAG: hydroxymethylbilane synthase [Planctomycetota bacterium]REK47280.1 MAG: hydroxymethylbilane synthase [Planctomycetota bacterium]
MTSKPPLRIGTRASALARWQADWVATRLRELNHDVQLVEVATQGDRDATTSVAALGSVGVFTKEIQRALLDERIDLAVHSLKDLPTETVDGLQLAAVPPREACGDVLIARDATKFVDLPAGARIGTGSLRRRSQLLHQRPDLEMVDIRGNVDTRLGKLADDDAEVRYDAIVLAEAGLRRLELTEHITEVLDKRWMLPAIGQGALGLETRADDAATRDALAALDDPPSHAAVVAERTMLATLAGGCLAPIGGWGRMREGQLRLDGAVLSRDGSERLAASATGNTADAAAVGRQVAEQLLDQGAAALIAAARRDV